MAPQKDSLKSDETAIASDSGIGLQPGDIMLVRYMAEATPEAELQKLLTLSLAAIRHYAAWDSYSEAQKHQYFADLTPFLQFAVTLFDGSPFYHALLMKEGHTLGAVKNSMATFYRYRHGAIHLGDAKLPAEPVLEAANAPGSTPDEPTAFETGFLAIWSLFRSGQQDCLPVLQTSLERLFGRSFTKLLLSEGRAQKLATLLSDLFHKAIDTFRDTEGRTGADRVAFCFNNADAEGTYRISREVKATSDAQLHAPLVHAAARVDEQLLEPLLTAIDAINLAPPLRPVSIALALVDSDTRYSPGDIAASVSTRPVLHEASAQP